MRTNYILIDYENVQPEALSALNAEHFKVIVFVGASQTKVTLMLRPPYSAWATRQNTSRFPATARTPSIFTLRFTSDSSLTQDPTAYLHIISKDTGFDPLIQHLKTKKVVATRSRDVSDISLVKVANTKSPAEKLVVIVADLKRRGVAKPRTVKTLLSTISSIFQKQLPEEEPAALLKELQPKGLVTVNGTKILIRTAHK